jgi:hypothetical protein
MKIGHDDRKPPEGQLPRKNADDMTKKFMTFLRWLHDEVWEVGGWTPIA